MVASQLPQLTVQGEQLFLHQLPVSPTVRLHRQVMQHRPQGTWGGRQGVGPAQEEGGDKVAQAQALVHVTAEGLAICRSLQWKRLIIGLGRGAHTGPGAKEVLQLAEVLLGQFGHHLVHVLEDIGGLQLQQELLNDTLHIAGVGAEDVLLSGQHKGLLVQQTSHLHQTMQRAVHHRRQHIHSILRARPVQQLRPGCQEVLVVLQDCRAGVDAELLHDLEEEQRLAVLGWPDLDVTSRKPWVKRQQAAQFTSTLFFTQLSTMTETLNPASCHP